MEEEAGSMPAREKFMIVAKDSQDNTVVVGPLDSPPSVALLAEIEEWGWTVQCDAAPVMTLGRARWDEKDRRLRAASR
jgi:hypothetical protein